MENLPLPNKIELHYHFLDSSHSMDAGVRNKCEAAILAIIREISIITGVEIKAETEAYTEGGLKEKIILITKNKFLLGVLSGLLINVLTDKLNTDPELKDLEKQKLKLEIKKLERDLDRINQENNIVNISQAASIINGSYKVIKQKSNFYNNLNSYRKVTSVSFKKLDENNRIIGKSIAVPNQEFKDFILGSDELPAFKDEEAIIEIISPVLSKRNYKWKGIYAKTGSPIDFLMKDLDFKEEVLHKGISFRHGTCIDCVLEIEKKLTDEGEVVSSGYTVTTVLKVRDIDFTFETPQGKKYNYEKELKKKQLAFNF